MFYINATANGEQLYVNPDSPIYVEIPSNDSKEDVMLFKGERDKDGKINWVNPKPVEKYLLPVNIMDLNFFERLLLSIHLFILPLYLHGF